MEDIDRMVGRAGVISYMPFEIEQILHRQKARSVSVLVKLKTSDIHRYMYLLCIHHC